MSASLQPNPVTDLDEVDLRPFDPYVAEIEALARRALSGERLVDGVDAALDGAPSRTLAALVSASSRRAIGAFFTSGRVRDTDFRALLPDTIRDRTALDPACGAGDLLLAWSRTLPADPELGNTLARWEPLILGCDLHEPFVRLARARLVLEAARRASYVRTKSLDLDRLFPGLTVSDGLPVLRTQRLPTWTVMNPPFGRVQAPANCGWASGLVSQAAVFVAYYLDAAVPGQHLVALLPDVLRTGTSMRRWREAVEQVAHVDMARPLGRFDRHADIDVFLLRLRREPAACRTIAWWEPPAAADGQVPLAEVAMLRVGSVVPFRDDLVGPAVPFLHPLNLPSGSEAEVPPERRRYSGPLFRPPFVAIRRTSRPGDRPRARSTVVVGTSPVAVENHLIVVTPRDQTVENCRAVAADLSAPAASDWLDQRLRGRHLTVTALNELLVRRP